MSKTIVTYRIVDGIDVDNIGHGVIWPRLDGSRARCLGESGCAQCKADALRKMSMSIDVLSVDDFTKAVELIAGAARQFRFYEQEHRAKLSNPNMSWDKLEETFIKAQTNAAWAINLENYINELQKQSETKA